MDSLVNLRLIEIGYFVIILAVGFGVGRFLNKKLFQAGITQGRNYLHLGLAVVFAIIAVLCMTTGSTYVPIWIGRNVIFFSGYYLGLIHWKRS